MGRAPLYFLLTILPAIVMTAPHLDKTREQASYHLKMLEKQISLIKRSLSSPIKDHKISKRSTEGMQADELILNSLSSYCSSFQSDAGIKELLKKRYDRQPLSSRDITGYKGFKPKPRNDFNMRLNAFPTKVLAQPTSPTQVWLIFYIAHSEDVKLSMLDPYDFQEAELKIPESSCQTIESKARFVVNSSRDICTKAEEDDIETAFRIGSAENTLTLYFVLCKYVNYGNLYSIKEEEGRFPTFQMWSDDGVGQSFIVIKNETLPKIYLEFQVRLLSQQEINLVAWDWEKNKTVYYSASVKKGYDYRSEYSIEYKQTKNFLLVENREHNSSKSILPVENQPFTVTISDTPCKRQSYTNYGSCVRVEVTVNSNLQRPRSGLLSATYLLKYTKGDGESEPIVRRAMLKRTMEIRLPDRTDVFPEGQIIFSPNQRFFCDENGDTGGRNAKYGKNCTVRCQAFGKGITSIYITKQGVLNHYARPGSYILEDEAAAVLNVGPYSHDVEGVYKCVVVDKNVRSETKDLNLYTSLFTKVNYIEMSDDNPEMTVVACRFEGGSDVRAVILVTDVAEEETIRLDEKYGANIIKANNTEENILNVIIPWTALKYPLSKLGCYAQGERGNDVKYKNLEPYNQNSYGIFPSFERSEFVFDYLDQGRLTAVCVARGVHPMEMWMAYDEFDYFYSPDYEYHQDANTTLALSNGLMSTMTVVFPNPTRYGRVYCKAKNKYATTVESFVESFY